MTKRPSGRTLGVAAASIALALAIGAPATAQLLDRGLPALPDVLGRLTAQGERLVLGLQGALDPQALLAARSRRLDALLRAHPRQLERDDRGAPVLRGEVLVVSPSTAALEAARRLGFAVARSSGADDAIGLVVLTAPPGVSARDAVRRLRGIDPAGTYDFNHVYSPSGSMAALQGTPSGRSSAGGAGPALRIGLVDTGVDTASPVFAAARIEQRGFAGPVKPAAHGTAVASLIAGEAPPFRGSAPGAALYVADVYGAAPVGGAADAVVGAVGWLLGRNVRVINISLVGPSNAALAAAVRAAAARGVAVVAPVGNDGPAAPAAYPASYPEVVSVTAVNSRGRVLLEAGRAGHLDFAAPGADLAAAAPGGGYVAVRGTSFAAPLVAGGLAGRMSRGLAPAAAVRTFAEGAVPGPRYGRGLVAVELRTPPAAVAARHPQR